MNLKGWRLFFCFSALVTLFISCETNPTAEPDATQLLAKTWAMNSNGFIKQESVDKTADYSGMTITFKNDGTYTSSKAGKLLQPSGTWTLQSTEPKIVVLDGDFRVEVLSLTETDLHVKFALDAAHVNASGRHLAVIGNYEILFKN